jgi:hypothetical protein
MNQDGNYYLWSGIGAIEDLDDAEPLTDTPAKALMALRGKQTGHWTLWLREGCRAVLVAVWMPGQMQEPLLFPIDCAELSRAGPDAFFLPRMSEHDRVRAERARNCDRRSYQSVRDAVLGLQSTDAPELVPLHDKLAALLAKLEQQQKKGIGDPT